MDDRILFVADQRTLPRGWQGALATFTEVTPERLAQHADVVLSPGEAEAEEVCRTIFGWKRDGLLDRTRLFLGTYKGRHLWSPDHDALVERWVVHARSEREVLDSERLYFIPLCISPPEIAGPPGDDGYAFMGGRKWREPEVGLAAMSRSGRPGLVITDVAPEGDFPGVRIQRERVPRTAYFAAIARARLVLVPLKRLPMSHGHVDVVTCIGLGKPVLVTAGCSCDDYVEHGVNGLLVPDNSVEAWTAAIAEAWDRAEEFAAAARAMAPAFAAERYLGYVQDMVADPDRHRVLPDPERVRRQAPRAEWQHLRQEHYLREDRQQQRAALDAARALLGQRRHAEAIAALAPCLAGAYRPSALRLLKTAQLRLDPAGAEPSLRALIAEQGPSAELAADLATSLLAQGRMAEALAEAERAVALDPTHAAALRGLAEIRRRHDQAA
jgi:tetratricopeptide (TPR) repeat protein